MLAKIIVRSVASAVVSINSFLSMFLSNNIDDTRHRIAAIERTLCSLYYFYLLNVVRINQSKVVLATHITMNAFAVDKYQDITIAKTIKLHLRTHIALSKSKRCRQACEDVLQTLAAVVAQHLLRDHLRLHRGIFQQVLGTSTRHHHFL